jgi:hypothetical protein
LGATEVAGREAVAMEEEVAAVKEVEATGVESEAD